jgi:hypothetical protein
VRTALVCTVLAAVSLLVFREATYDPTAWLIWGRQIAHGTLETTAGPSWKPLPVLLTTPLSVLGDTGAMKAWLVVARVGGLASLLLAYRVAARLQGRAAGVIAALALALAAEYEFNWLRGNSEGLLVAAALLSVDRHLEQRHLQAFAAGVAAALLRPDVWPLLTLYGLWLLHRHRDARTAVVVVGSGIAVALLWFVPEYIGSGDLLRGASRAREPVAGSPGASDNPFLSTFSQSAQALSYGVYAGAVLALGAAVRDRAVAAIAAASGALMVIVALLATTGFTGNLRYVALPMGLLCVLSGVGWAWFARRVPVAAVAVAALAVLPGLIEPIDRVGDNLARTREVDRFYAALPGFIERAGGRAAVLRCGPVYTGPYSTQAVAYRLHVRQREVGLHPLTPGAVLDGARSRLGTGNRDFTLKEHSTEWILRTTC